MDSLIKRIMLSAVCITENKTFIRIYVKNDNM